MAFKHNLMLFETTSYFPLKSTGHGKSTSSNPRLSVVWKLSVDFVLLKQLRHQTVILARKLTEINRRVASKNVGLKIHVHNP